MTYEEIAQGFGFRLCPGAEVCGIHFVDHELGWPSYDNGIHWRPRQVRKHGLYRFLKHVVVLRMGLQPMRGGPEKLWLLSAGAYDLALSLGVRLPREILAQDRTLVRSWLATGYGPNTDDETRRKIQRWARP
jgi:hypothetical protein